MAGLLGFDELQPIYANADERCRPPGACAHEPCPGAIAAAPAPSLSGSPVCDRSKALLSSSDQDRFASPRSPEPFQRIFLRSASAAATSTKPGSVRVPGMGSECGVWCFRGLVLGRVTVIHIVVRPETAIFTPHWLTRPTLSDASLLLLLCRANPVTLLYSQSPRRGDCE